MPSRSAIVSSGESRAPEPPRLLLKQFNQNSLLPKLCGEPQPRRNSTAASPGMVIRGTPTCFYLSLARGLECRSR